MLTPANQMLFRNELLLFTKCKLITTFLKRCLLGLLPYKAELTNAKNFIYTLRFATFTVPYGAIL